MKKIDIIISLIIGEAVAWLFLGLFKSLAQEIKFIYWILPILFPILSLVGLWLAEIIGRKFLFVFQLVKFLLMGALATLIDLGIFNFLMGIFGITKGVMFSVFVGFSFIIATSIKYFGDKFWAFEKMEKKRMGREFSQFFAVTLVSGGIHIGIASIIVNVLGPQFGFSSFDWANIGKILGIIGAFIWNFLGYKFIVFKK